jgi:hypothetical protein
MKCRVVWGLVSLKKDWSYIVEFLRQSLGRAHQCGNVSHVLDASILESFVSSDSERHEFYVATWSDRLYDEVLFYPNGGMPLANANMDGLSTEIRILVCGDSVCWLSPLSLPIPGSRFDSEPPRRNTHS